MSPPLQVKLLRILQEMEFERVGGSQTLKVDVRVVAASNRNLKDEVANGRFRNDLYYRLNVVHVYLPPLGERPDDLPLLVNHFLDKYAKENHQELMATLRAPWSAFLNIAGRVTYGSGKCDRESDYSFGQA